MSLETAPVRHAAKAILYTPDDRFLLTLGERPLAKGGRWNLVGGGIEPGETANQAFGREVKEELGPDFPFVGLRLEEAGTVEGDVTDRNGRPLRAQWTVLAGKLLDISSLDAQLAAEQVALMSAHDMIGHIPSGKISELAVRAVLEYGLPRLG